MRNLITATILFSGLAQGAYGKTAAELQCNHKQTKCVTDNQNISIGDEVGVFNTDGELVATGEVSHMKGERRAVIINKRHGAIHGNYNLALLETRTSDAKFKESYTIYQEPTKLSVGGEAGLSTWNIGSQTPAPEYSVFAQWREWGGLQVIARGVFTSLDGTVTGYDRYVGFDEEALSVKGFGLLGGLGYVVREGKTLSFRGELGFGAMYVDATVGGGTNLVEEPAYKVHMKNGMNPFGRGTIGAILSFGTWHMHMDVAESVVTRASGTTMAVGVSKDIK